MVRQGGEIIGKLGQGIRCGKYLRDWELRGCCEKGWAGEVDTEFFRGCLAGAEVRNSPRPSGARDFVRGVAAYSNPGLSSSLPLREAVEIGRLRFVVTPVPKCEGPGAPGRGWLCDPFLRFDVGAENGVHAGEMAFAVGLEPLDDVAVEAQVNGSFAGRQGDAGGLPEIFSERFGAWGVGAGPVETAGAHRFDFAKRISRRSRFLLHVCLPFGR
jgi:hypothetical protein